MHAGVGHGTWVSELLTTENLALSGSHRVVLFVSADTVV